MSESCLVLSPAARNEGMRQKSGMGISSRDAVSEVGTIRNQEMSSQNSSVAMKQPNSPRQVTDESETSECKKKKKSADSTNMRQGSSGENDTSESTSKRKLGALQRSGPVLEDEQQQQQQSSENGTSDAMRNLSLPQHQRIQEVEPLDISYCCTPASLKLKGVLVSRLSEVASSGRIQVIDLSRRGLGEEDAELIRFTLRSNPQLAVLKLGYNDLGDAGASIIAPACSKDGRHHQNLTVLDMGFNNIGDEGITSLSLQMIAGNHVLRNLFLSGNRFKQKGAMAIAGAILHGCSLNRLNVSANNIGADGMKVLARAVAEMDARRQHLLQRQGGIVIAAIKPPALEELHVSDIKMETQGLASISSMIISNSSLHVLNICNNDIDDRQMALLSQALAQNRGMQLKSIQLSFNKITCVGVESFMNSVWGSTTLKELRLDNNKIQDRGAQLCSVVLGSIRLEVLDLGFNRVSTVGVKALMKSLSENDTLRVLSLSGIPMDQNASKAVSYALAYNPSLEVFSVDSCCIGYSGQRHIVAGIVSNRNVKLKNLTGFSLGAITKTLGLPQVPEDWGNDRVLSFVRYMWLVWRAQHPEQGPQRQTRGPAPPSTVAASGKTAFALLSSSDEAKLQFQQELAGNPDESPMIAPDTSILVRSNSGQNLQIPAWNDNIEGVEEDEYGNDWSSETDSLDRSSYTGSSTSSLNVGEMSTERRSKNLQWLRAHFQSLNEIGNLVFNNADLWQLHQYFFSPAYGASDESEADGSVQEEMKDDSKEDKNEDRSSPFPAPPSTPVATDPSNPPSMGRSISFQTLGRAVSAAAVGVDASRPNKRGSLDEALKDAEPCKKRAKSLKPRIAYYPRIREKLESLGTKPSAQTLSLLRQLKYIESVMLQGKNVYIDTDNAEEDESPSALDVEMILLDLL